ncbi:hypothetical protein [Nocardia sp. 348MFTsu5.1]|uniref:T3SS (YopN, CesT) and YbjN peptide-binding chaperone 1 n=1 Tax=Nocardia sp. 348MFTsu5.1 TaxID=1172185 RepID=UPI0003702FB1|nr:hypothetical protein [Nocardia sp. 348MFTsu5.1]
MSNLFDFDASVADGWAAFRDELTTQLTELQASGSVRVTAPNAALNGSGPSAFFTITADDEVRCHLSPTPLGLDRDLDDDEVQLLMDLEWDSISQDECVVERGRDEVEHVVLAATVVIQELWQVVHPTFLLTVQEWGTGPIQHIGFQAAGQSQLRDLVDDALERITGSSPNKDDDGDVTFTGNGVMSWLCVDPSDPVIEMFTNLAVEVHDSAAASEALMEFSRHWPDIRFLLINGCVRASIRMDATVFTDAVLRSTLIKWFDFLTDGAGEVASAIAEVDTEPQESDEALPVGLLCLMELDDDDEGPLSPREIATACEFDRDAILHYLQVSQKMERTWRRSVFDARECEDEEEARACEHEEQSWSRRTKRLRAALRLVVLSSPLNEVR